MILVMIPCYPLHADLILDNNKCDTKCDAASNDKNIMNSLIKVPTTIQKYTSHTTNVILNVISLWPFQTTCINNLSISFD